MKDTTLDWSVKEAAIQSTRAAKILYFIGLLLHLVFSGSGHYMNIMIRSLQIIIHLPILFAIVPGNVIAIFRVIIALVMFDLLENEYGIGLEMFLTFDIEGQEEISL